MMKEDEVREKFKMVSDQYHLLRNQVSNLDDKKRKEENQALIGKYFKFHNSYGSGEKWWLYAKVVYADSHYVHTIAIQTLPGEGIELKQHSIPYHLSGYTPCKKSEFDRAYKAALKKIREDVGY